MLSAAAENDIDGGKHAIDVGGGRDSPAETALRLALARRLHDRRAHPCSQRSQAVDARRIHSRLLQPTELRCFSGRLVTRHHHGTCKTCRLCGILFCTSVHHVHHVHYGPLYLPVPR